jgi:DNA repair photolyase
MVVNEKAVNKKWKKYDGVVMFPSVHDITPAVLEPCLTTIGHILDAGNKILIVSKPHLECIQAICKMFDFERDQIVFRFTIGADSDEVLGYWEPHAPTFQERLASLSYAWEEQFATSVSIEPMLDRTNIIRLVDTIYSFVSDTIWIGKMNAIGKRVAVVTDEDRQQVAQIVAGQTDEEIKKVYLALKDNPKVRWKESIKQVVGLPLATQAGLDI